MQIGYLGLGCNVGDRRANLQAAVDALPGHGVAVLASSSTYDTDPVGEIREQPQFLNACIRVQTELEPEALLDACKAVERELGRQAGGPRHGPRAIDVDLLLRTCLAFLRGEPRVCSMVPVSEEAEEDARHPGREREELVAERIALTNRIGGILTALGVEGYDPLRRDRRRRLGQLRTALGDPLPANAMARILRMLDRRSSNPAGCGGR